MNERDLLRQIIESCDDALKEAFLRRMDLSLRVARTNMERKLPIYDAAADQAALRYICDGLSPELTRSAQVLWKTLLRMSRGRQYRFFIENDPTLKLAHESDLVPALGDGTLACIEDAAVLVSSTLHREVEICHSIAAALTSVEKGKTAFAALTVESLYETEWLYSMIAHRPLYVNAIRRTKEGPLIVLLSRTLATPGYIDPVVSIAFIIPSAHGTLAQAISVLSDHRLNIEFLQFKKCSYEDIEDACLVVIDLSGDIASADVRSSLFQLATELPFFRVVGFRESVDV